MLVEIDEEKLNQSLLVAIDHATKCLLFEGSYSREAGAGYSAVEKAVHDYMATIDLQPMIKAAVAEKLDVLIKNVVETTLIAKIKKTAKEMEKGGKLFEKAT